MSFEIGRWVTALDAAELQRFLGAYPSSTAIDLDGAPVFLAGSAFTLKYEQDRWPAILFSDIKDYQRAA